MDENTRAVYGASPVREETRTPKDMLRTVREELMVNGAKRWDLEPTTRCGSPWLEMVEDSMGDWVLYDEYAELAAERDALRVKLAEIDALLDEHYAPHPYPGREGLLCRVYALIDAWRRALGALRDLRRHPGEFAAEDHADAVLREDGYLRAKTPRSTLPLDDSALRAKLATVTSKKHRSCNHCGNDACTFHHPICAESLYEHEKARRNGMPTSGRHG